jgi:hypothetical protein
MNRHQIIEIMLQPHLLNEATLTELRVILDEYPFFQSARLLWIKNLHALEHIRYNNELKLAAIHIPDRARLYDLLQNCEGYTSTSTQESVAIEKDTTALCQVAEGTIGKTEEAAKSVKPEVLPTGSYFEVDDTFDTSLGIGVDFSKLLANVEVPEEKKHGFQRVEENMVLPSADLLDYERTGSVYYHLSEAGVGLNLDESRSFSAWLHVLRQAPVPEPDKVTRPEVAQPRTGKKSLIDNFLQQGTKKRVKMSGDVGKAGENEDISIKSFQESEDLMTETLANIFIQQKHFSKAMEIFERLGLKYPEKSIYFARRIKELEEQINNQ